MEIYPAQFHDDSRPEPSRRAEDLVFDPIQSTAAAQAPRTTRGSPVPRSTGNGLHPMVVGRGPLRPAGQGYPVATE